MYCTFISQTKWMQTKILKDRPTLFGKQRKNWEGAIVLLAPLWLPASLNTYYFENIPIKSLPQLASKFYSVTKNWVGNSLFCLNDATPMEALKKKQWCFYIWPFWQAKLLRVPSRWEINRIFEYNNYRTTCSCKREKLKVST